MTVFEAAKQASCSEAAARLGLQGKRTGAARGVYSCPWHQDKTPSMVCYDGRNHFHCFSCGRHGDATDLYAAVLGLGLCQAAMRVCEDFGLRWEHGRKDPAQWQPPREPSDAARNAISLCKAWQKLAMRIAQDEINRATKRLEELKSPSHPGWNANLAIAVRYQDEYNRYKCMEVSDLLENMKDEMIFPEESEDNA